MSTINPTKEKTVRKKRTSHLGKFYTAPTKETDKGITVTLPIEVLNYLGVKTELKEVYWTAINGVIQISAVQPHIVIPMMSVDVNRFMAQR